MCAGCLNHLLADGRLKNEMPTCPNCRIEITESLCIRNLAVEKAVLELPTKCKFCQRDIPRCSITKHEKHLCFERLEASLVLIPLFIWLSEKIILNFSVFSG